VSVPGVTADLGALLLNEGLVWVFEDYPVQRTPSYRSAQQQALGAEIGGWAVCGWAR
jgi:endonuclease YncB( thermonuclease family)